MKDKTKPKASENGKLITAMYYAAAILMPGIFLFNLYNRNYVENLIVFEHVLILMGILAVAGMLLFVIFKWVTGSIEGALLVICAFWVCFWLFHAFLSRVQRFSDAVSEMELVVLFGTCIVLAAVCFRQFSPPFYKIRPTFNVLAFCLVALFFYNLFPAVNNQFVLSRARSSMSDSDYAQPFRIRHDFVVDPGLPHPDVHWIHADGMMRINTVEDFYGEDFSWFRDEIASRGFVLNEDAMLTAGYTYSALAAMLSPEFYDTFFGELIAQNIGKLRLDKSAGMADGLAQVGLTYEYDIVPSYELLSAFLAAGYTLDIRNMAEYMPGYSAERWSVVDHFMNSDLPGLLSLTTPIRFPDRHEWAMRDAEGGSANLFSPTSDTSGGPRFTWYGVHDAHMDNAWLYDPNMTEIDAGAIHLYPLAYYSAMQQVMVLLDVILASDPDAVIVIESDHGFHMVPTQAALLEQGYSVEEILELNYSVLSAVRIPDTYGGVAAPIDPLNISRELANRFVGENYKLLR